MEMGFIGVHDRLEGIKNVPGLIVSDALAIVRYARETEVPGGFHPRLSVIHRRTGVSIHLAPDMSTALVYAWFAKDWDLDFDDWNSEKGRFVINKAQEFKRVVKENTHVIHTFYRWEREKDETP